jgi:hypothetical protein
VLLQKLFFLLEHYPALFPGHEVPHTELVAWALLTLRYIKHLDDPRPAPTESAEHTASSEDKNASAATAAQDSVAYAYYTRLSKILCEIEDPVVQMRMFTEFSALVVHHAIDSDFAALQLPASEEWAKHGISRTGYRFTATLPAALLRSSAVRALLDAGVRTVHAAVLARFVSALCSTYTAMLNYTLTPVLVLLQSVHTACSASTGPAPAATPTIDVDVFSFTPTVVHTSAPVPAHSSKSQRFDAGDKGHTDVHNALLDAYLTGREESLHPWALLRDGVAGARVRRLCTRLHTALRQHSAQEANAAAAATVEKVKGDYQQLVWILAALVEGAVFAVKTFEK